MRKQLECQLKSGQTLIIRLPVGVDDPLSEQLVKEVLMESEVSLKPSPSDAQERPSEEDKTTIAKLATSVDRLTAQVERLTAQNRDYKNELSAVEGMFTVWLETHKENQS